MRCNRSRKWGRFSKCSDIFSNHGGNVIWKFWWQNRKFHYENPSKPLFEYKFHRDIAIARDSYSELDPNNSPLCNGTYMHQCGKGEFRLIDYNGYNITGYSLIYFPNLKTKLQAEPLILKRVLNTAVIQSKRLNMVIRKSYKFKIILQWKMMVNTLAKFITMKKFWLWIKR